MKSCVGGDPMGLGPGVDGVEVARISKLALAGGIVFWGTTIVISVLPIAVQFRATSSVAHVQVLVGSLIAGLLLGFIVSYLLLNYPGKIPGRSPVVKSVFICVAALVIIEPLVIFIRSDNAAFYDLVGAALDVPRFLLLGLTIGCFSERF